ncbi:hypothetical protein V8B97DRAFT_1918578 [Scleroderma yunnanense]
MYDYLLTFGKEIDRFWKKPRPNWAFSFFIINRYLTLLGRIPAFMVNFVQTNDNPYNHLSVVSISCDRLILTDEFTMGCVQIAGAVVMVIRVYAIYNKSRRILCMLVPVLVITTVIGIYTLLVGSPNYPKIALVPPQGCLRAISQQEAYHYAAAWGGQLVFDAMVFGLTVWRLFDIESLGSHSLVDILLLDGAMYFAVMTVMNITNITTFLVATKLEVNPVKPHEYDLLYNDLPTHDEHSGFIKRKWIVFKVCTCTTWT